MSRTQEHAILAELRLLLEGLGEARGLADEEVQRLEAERLDDPSAAETRRISIRREAARVSLRRVISFLLSDAVASWDRAVMQFGLENHLRDLLDSLNDVAGGAPASLFQPSPSRGKVTSQTDEEFRAKVAAAAELMYRATDDLDEACREVARQLHELGWRKPYSRKAEAGDDQITGGTVRAWRKKAMEAGRQSWIGKVYLHHLETARKWEARGISPAEWVRLLMAGLAQDLRGGLAFVTRTDRPPGSEK